jgi:hypothetical protein
LIYRYYGESSVFEDVVISSNMSTELCAVCQMADGKPELKCRYTSYYRSRDYHVYMCSQKCFDEFYYKQRCGRCTYRSTGLQEYDGRVYCTSREYWPRSCLETVRDRDNDVCSFCKRPLSNDDRGETDDGFWCEKCYELRSKREDCEVADKILDCLRYEKCYDCGTVPEKSDRIYLPFGDNVIIKCATCIESSKQLMRELTEEIGLEKLDRIIQFGQLYGDQWKKQIDNQ